MSIDQAPIDVNEPQEPVEAGPVDAGLTPDAPAANPISPAPESAPPVVRGSRWVDYDTHELLQLISDLEDERRWARFREGVWLAILIHAALFAAVLLLPKYVFVVPPVVDSSKIAEHQEFTYFDAPRIQPKIEIKPVPIKPPEIDKKTLEDLNKTAPPPPAPEPAPQAAPAPPAPVPPAPQAQAPEEEPRPSAVPARAFAMNSQNPADALRDAMKNASRDRRSTIMPPPPDIMRLHPDANMGGAEILSDTQGVDFDPYIRHIVIETERTWDPLAPDEVNPPISKRGQVLIRFKLLPNGRIMDGSMVLEGSSGDVALDRAAWGALTGSNFPPLPREFHGPYLELRFLFIY